MLKVIAHNYIRPDAIDAVMPLYRELVEQTLREPLCIEYVLFVDQTDPGHFVFVETWPDRAALDIHSTTEHFNRLVPKIAEYARAPSVVQLLNAALESN